MGPKPAYFGAFSTTFGFPKSALPSTYGHANTKNIHILENFSGSDQNIHFGESEPNNRKIGNTPRHKKCTYFGENIYCFQEKKYLLHFPKIYA